MNVKLLIAVLAAAPSLAGSAYADERCGNVADADWKTVAEVVNIATEAGYTVREVERDDNCYELNVVDGQGQRFELDIHPGTGEIVKTDRD